MKFNTLTLGQLITRLQEAEQEYGPDVPVVTSTNYEDCDDSQQALAFIGNTTLTSLMETSQYSSGFRIADEDDESSEQESPKYLLIS